jgi:hypothetical protein
MSHAGIRPAIRRLLFVADAAVADVDELPRSVRTIIDAAAEVYVVGAHWSRPCGSRPPCRAASDSPGRRPA